MTVKSIHSAFFLSSINVSDKLILASNLKSILGEVLDGEPLILPIPDNAPHEIPRIILKSKNEEYELNISLSRVDFIFNNKSNAAIQYKKITEAVMKYLAKLSKVLIDKHSMSTNRTGLIVTFGSDVKVIDKVLELFNVEFKDIKNKQEIQLNLLQKQTVGEFNVNNWVRIIAQKHDTSRQNYILLNDINIDIKDKKDLTSDLINKFYNTMFNEIVKNIKPYGTDNIS
ncbi:hypothetical protein KJ980_03955 [Patescibacteria group bacterium]|nr:hypothetical protein [Patescibacteria group bacterium]MBU4017161.1 hypothetical protein [Patescibacteria group bacterium]MBU4098778.1 hypothetical protein [Patescibacteria group bacterium]